MKQKQLHENENQLYHMWLQILLLIVFILLLVTGCAYFKYQANKTKYDGKDGNSNIISYESDSWGIPVTLKRNKYTNKWHQFDSLYLNNLQRRKPELNNLNKVNLNFSINKLKQNQLTNTYTIIASPPTNFRVTLSPAYPTYDNMIRSNINITFNDNHVIKNIKESLLYNHPQLRQDDKLDDRHQSDVTIPYSQDITLKNYYLWHYLRKYRTKKLYFKYIDEDHRIKSDWPDFLSDFKQTTKLTASIINNNRIKYYDLLPNIQKSYPLVALNNGFYYYISTRSNQSDGQWAKDHLRKQYQNSFIKPRFIKSNKYNSNRFKQRQLGILNQIIKLSNKNQAVPLSNNYPWYQIAAKFAPYLRYYTYAYIQYRDIYSRDYSFKVYRQRHYIKSIPSSVLKRFQSNSPKSNEKRLMRKFDNLINLLGPSSGNYYDNLFYLRYINSINALRANHNLKVYGYFFNFYQLSKRQKQQIIQLAQNINKLHHSCNLSKFSFNNATLIIALNKKNQLQNIYLQFGLYDRKFNYPQYFVYRFSTKQGANAFLQKDKKPIHIKTFDSLFDHNRAIDCFNEVTR